MEFCKVIRRVVLMKLIFMLSLLISIQEREPYSDGFVKKTPWHYYVFRHLFIDFFQTKNIALACVQLLGDFLQTWYHDRHDQTVQFNTSFLNFDFHSRSKLYGKAKIFYTHFLENFLIDLDQRLNAGMICWFREIYANLILQDQHARERTLLSDFIKFTTNISFF